MLEDRQSGWCVTDPKQFQLEEFFLTEIKLREIAFKCVNCSYTSFSWNFRGHIEYGYPNIQQSENNTIREPGLEYTPWLSNFLGIQRSCALWLLGLEMTLAERGIYIQNYKNIKTSRRKRGTLRARLTRPDQVSILRRRAGLPTNRSSSSSRSAGQIRYK